MTRPVPPAEEPPRVPLYGEDFAADPHAVYDRLRTYGACAPVELAPGVHATLVTNYRVALRVLHDTETFSKDPRVWQHTVPEDSEVLAMMSWRPNVLYNDGEVHTRYRRALTDCVSLIEPFDLRQLVHRSADALIRAFGERGSVELIGEYARLLPLMIFNGLFGMPDADSARLIGAMARMFDSTSEEATRGLEELQEYILDTVSRKHAERGNDFTSWLLDHPEGLTPEEVVWHLVLSVSAGHEPVTNLIGNALARMLSDSRYYRTLTSGALTSGHAITEVLWQDPPMANFSTHFPRRDVDLDGTWVRSGTPVLISYAAANTDPTGRTGGPRSDAGAHLAFAAGPHACPMQQPGLLIATTAIDRLTNWLCDIRLSVPYAELTWRRGPFHRALAALPAQFTPISPDQKGSTPWNVNPSSSTPVA
ncbi:cytochrome P450 [Streptomyces sp. RFCAC02]|uniref:cytochrome P450 n=1 Tax=Streptomyces sp. RFCAC02 TaxID=2499143 RepID=UPI00101EA29E|nr:cytochrome P450 [Streptomyces sp. RFCAC02]